MKAQEQLEDELDIQNLIRGNRLVQNLFKVMTTKRERRLGRLQASKNTVSDHKTKKFTDYNTEKFLEDMIAQGTNLQLSARESQLIRGIASPILDKTL